MVTFNSKGSTFHNVGQLYSGPSKMTAFIECGECGKQGAIDANNGTVKCSCGSTHFAKMTMGSGKPDWFKG